MASRRSSRVDGQRNFTRRTFLKMAAGAGTTLLVSASSPAATAAPAKGDSDLTLTIVDSLEPNSLDPPVGTDQFGHPIYAMYDGLVQFTLKGDIVPKLATSWVVGPDKLTWTFKLRPNVKFHDGTPFNSEAVKFSLERIMGDPKVRATRKASYAFLDIIETPDPLTVKIKSKQPYPDLPSMMADRSSMMVSPAAAKDAVAFGRNPVGTGPFKFVEWRSKERVVMEAFPDYWGDKPKIKQFVFRAVTEGATRSALLRTGEADIVLNIPVQDIVALKADPNVVVEIIPTLTMSIPQWSVKAGPFKDVRVRKAANLAVNRQEILQKVLGGAGVIPRSSISQGIWGAVELPPMPYDPAEAKKLLAAAGYPNGFKGTYSYVKREETLHQASIGYLKAVGIDMQAKVVEQPERLVLLAQEPEKYPGDIVEVTRTGQFISYLMERIYLCREANAPAAQRSGYCNPAVDEALNKGGTSFDQNERLKAYAEAQKLLWEDYALFWLIGLSMPIGYRKGVSGFVVLPSREVLVAGVSKS